MTIQGQGILDGSRLKEYFREEIQRATCNQNVTITDTLEFYLVNLLTSFNRTEHLFKREDDRFEDEPLALMLTRAIEGDTATQIRELKRLGDTSLYITGFFANYIDRKTVDANYYIGMGSCAYESLAGIFTSQKTFAELYAELSQKFSALTSILCEVSIADNLKTNMDILRLYEMWLKTGNEKMRRLLAKEGIIPTAKKISC